MMDKFTRHEGVAAVLLRSNVDTDAIIPSREMKRVSKEGLGEGLFAGWRYLAGAGRQKNPGFVLNQDGYQGASILLSGPNFGCGSSREHAVWALDEYGIRCVIAPSFADIFFTNSFKSGLLPVALDTHTVDRLFREVEATLGYRLVVDLHTQTVTTPDGVDFHFDVDEFRKQCLLNGWDDIGLTLRHADDIRAYEIRRREEAPWLFAR